MSLFERMPSDSSRDTAENPGLICESCGLPVVPFGGEGICACEPESELDDSGEEWDELHETDDHVLDCMIGFLVCP